MTWSPTALRFVYGCVLRRRDIKPRARAEDLHPDKMLMTRALMLLAAAPARAYLAPGAIRTVVPLRVGPRVPPPLASSRQSRYFADADTDGDGELSATEILAFISRPRISILAFGVPVAFIACLGGSSLLDTVLVEALGVNRADSDAFGPFVTLLGLIYSIQLSQTYGYYFDRQGVIQDALYQEIGCIQELAAALDALCDRYPDIDRAESYSALHAHASSLLNRGFVATTTLEGEVDTRRLVALLDALDAPARRSAIVLSTMRTNVRQIGSSRAARLSAVAADLPVVQRWSERVLSVLLLLGFLLVDLGGARCRRNLGAISALVIDSTSALISARSRRCWSPAPRPPSRLHAAPKLEALLFAGLAGVFGLLNTFIDDLSDPFGGAWNVDNAREELGAVASRLASQCGATETAATPRPAAAIADADDDASVSRESGASLLR